VTDLEILKLRRKALLLAEAIGWLHDYRKCSEEHLQTLAANRQGQGIPRPELGKRYPGLQNIQIALVTTRDVLSLLNDKTWGQDLLGQLLSRCHNTSHFDKQEPTNGTQNFPGTQISSPFGFEQPVTSGLTSKMWGLPWNDLATISKSHSILRDSIRTLFSQAIADSRRPINEVDLWSWGSFVGVLYKSALAWMLLTGQSSLDPQKIRWRLLSIRTDGLEYISNVTRIPDLLARQKILSSALNRVRRLLETTYPLGSEVYRDQNGSVFVVPDISTLLDYTNDKGETLRYLVSQAFEQALEGDLAPQIELESTPWWGQDPGWPQSNNDELPDIRAMLSKRIIIRPNIGAVEKFWRKNQSVELCPVCRLRPMKEGQEVCETCLNRRQSRIREWRNNPHATIWIDEIADHNGHVALLVGRFGLDDWLSGDLVQTMRIRAEENNPSANGPKNPSPARLRRIWETCQRFWAETVDEILKTHLYNHTTALRCIRVAVVPDDISGWHEGMPYDGTINGKSVSLFWQEPQKRFITISNLRLGVSTARDEVGLTQEWHGGTCTVFLPDKPGRARTFTVQQVHLLTGEQLQTYSPYLPLLESPDRFLALVPAAAAVEIANRIKEEYERQMGKVQDRLPLFLGLVFFPRKMPLMAVMDTARRMLDVRLNEEQWRVDGCRVDDMGLRRHVDLSQGERRISLEVPVKMRDDQTDDLWYPYFFVEHFADGSPDSRQYRFKHKSGWQVHVNNLKQDDVVRVTPSRFTYLWLEHTAKRFTFDPERDLLLLDELPRLKGLWEALKQCGITDTALRNVQSLLEAKAAAWGTMSEEFQHLVEATLKEAGLYARKAKDNNPLPDVVSPGDVYSGRFARCLELYLHILKQKMKED